ncbi:MAG: Secreted protein with PKD repeat domain [Candidatus Methanohalarchaeum thermophilum]|uniref:Secreted protein with PKD repeat domain n=1 Tax=Methanohalarchaeum thermophilum TaxID=1903181 RepID=A0A1Q6DW00_METT1|nr:MAG: Secreted protein with PKD repeat domain [Candidatus Methanohalarchaeum thermophilum]
MQQQKLPLHAKGLSEKGINNQKATENVPDKVKPKLPFVSEVNLEKIPEEGGTVSGEGFYTIGREITIKAEPKEGYIFKCWNTSSPELIEDAGAKETTLTVPREDITVKAKFIQAKIVEQGESIQKAIDEADSGDTIVVCPGTYQENINLNKEYLTVKSKADAQNVIIKGRIVMSAEGTTLDGFTVNPEETYTTDIGDRAGIRVTASNVLIENNIVEGVHGDASGNEDTMSVHGIQIWSDGPTIKDIEITNNVVKDIINKGNPEEGWPHYGGAVGVKVQGDVSNVLAEGNTIKDIHSAGWTYGIVTSPSDNAEVQPKDVSVLRNNIEEINDGTEYNVFEEVGAPYP